MWKPLIVGAVIGAALGWFAAPAMASGGRIDRTLRQMGVTK